MLISHITVHTNWRLQRREVGGGVGLKMRSFKLCAGLFVSPLSQSNENHERSGDLAKDRDIRDRRTDRQTDRD